MFIGLSPFIPFILVKHFFFHFCARNLSNIKKNRVSAYSNNFLLLHLMCLVSYRFVCLHVFVCFIHFLFIAFSFSCRSLCFFAFLLFPSLSSVGCSFTECVHLSVCLPRPPSIPCASFTLLYKIKIDYFFSTCCNVSTFWQLLCLEYITEFVLFFLRCSVFFILSFFHHIHVFAFHCMWEPYVCFVVFIFVFVSVILSWFFFFFSFSSPIFHMNASHALYIPYVCDFFWLVYLFIFCFAHNFILLCILYFNIYVCCLLLSVFQ